MPSKFPHVDFGGVEDSHAVSDEALHGMGNLSFDNNQEEIGKEQNLPQLVAGKMSH